MQSSPEASSWQRCPITRCPASTTGSSSTLKLDNPACLHQDLPSGRGRRFSQSACHADHLAENDHHALYIARGIIEKLPPPPHSPPPPQPWQPPAGDPAALRELHFQDGPIDPQRLIDAVLDRGSFYAFKDLYGSSLVTGAPRTPHAAQLTPC